MTRAIRETLALVDLVLDPELQMRAEGVVAEVAERYAELLRNGTELPPLEAVRVGDEVLLVDGWHRHDPRVRGERAGARHRGSR